jgi:hypothetical protein
MGRLIHQLPNEDPARLSRVLDAKYRCIGVRHAPLGGSEVEVEILNAHELAYLIDSSAIIFLQRSYLQDSTPLNRLMSIL